MAKRLYRESSPYLLQHADNPVDRYPWGAEAVAAGLLGTAHAAFHANRVVVGGDPEGTLPELAVFKGRGPVDGKPAAQVCRHFACQAPVTTPEALREARRELG